MCLLPSEENNFTGSGDQLSSKCEQSPMGEHRGCRWGDITPKRTNGRTGGYQTAESPEHKTTGEHEIAEHTSTTFDPAAKQILRGANITRREARSFSYLGKVRMALMPSIHVLQPICVRLAQVAIMPRPPVPISDFHGTDIVWRLQIILQPGQPALDDATLLDVVRILRQIAWIRSLAFPASSQPPLIHGERCNCEECIATTAEFSDETP